MSAVAPHPASERGLLFAGGAVLVWSTSSVTTSFAVNQAPPLLVLAVSFTVAAALGLLRDQCHGRLRATLAAPWPVVGLGLYGIASYYLAFYFAFRYAPAVQVSLINYLWPLLTVLLSAPILRTPLPRGALPAALVGLLGAVLVVTGGRLPHLSAQHALGYALALWAAVSWAVFSCLLRRIGPAAAGRMPLFCLCTAGLAWLAVLATGALGAHGGTWLAVAVVIGIGPLFGAFECWDRAMQWGDIARIGLLSYLTPALSTLWLALAGQPLNAASVLGMVLIIAAGLLGRRA